MGEILVHVHAHHITHKAVVNLLVNEVTNEHYVHLILKIKSWVVRLENIISKDIIKANDSAYNKVNSRSRGLRYNGSSLYVLSPGDLNRFNQLIVFIFI